MVSTRLLTLSWNGIMWKRSANCSEERFVFETHFTESTHQMTFNPITACGQCVSHSNSSATTCSFFLHIFLSFFLRCLQHKLLFLALSSWIIFRFTRCLYFPELLAAPFGTTAPDVGQLAAVMWAQLNHCHDNWVFALMESSRKSLLVDIELKSNWPNFQIEKSQTASRYLGNVFQT